MLSEPSYEQELMRVMQSIGASDPAAARLGVSTPDDEPTEELETDEEQVQPNEVPAPLIVTRVTSKTLFSHPDSHPVVLDLALLYKYGAEWLEWEPETLRYYTSDDLGPMSDLNFSKVMACKTLHMIDAFWQRWEVFVWCTMPFNSVFPDFNVMQVPTVAQCAVAVDIATRIREEPWSEEMKEYLTQVFLHDGVLVSLPPLDFVKVPHEEYEVDVDEVRKRWPSVRATSTSPAGDTMVDEQLRYQFGINQFLEESRTRLRAQLPLVQHA